MLAFRLQRQYLPSRSLGSLRVRVLSPSQRHISYSPVLWNITNTPTTSTELKAVTEIQDIKALDGFLKLVS